MPPLSVEFVNAAQAIDSFHFTAPSCRFLVANSIFSVIRSCPAIKLVLCFVLPVSNGYGWLFFQLSY
jgi:hypothetical protein